MQASRYRISRLVDRGGTAEVFEAYIIGEHGFERRVALKQLREEALSEEGFVEHFIDEARIAAQLHHANVVSVFDFGVMDGRPFLVLEYVDGLDLHKLLQQAGQIEPKIALAVTLEVARALAYAHKAKDSKGVPLRIVHRDVSPSNVLLSFSGEVKLSDFGIALAVERLVETRVGYAKGKLSFMSPEQMNGGAVDQRADIYSLGLLLHFMVTGRSPLEREETREKVRRGGDCTIARELDRDLASIVLRATKTDPARRYRTADELAAEVGPALMRRSVDRDARALLEEFMEKLAPRAEPPPRSPLAEMMDVELVLADVLEPLRRFESVVAEGQTALASMQTDEIEADRLDKTEPSEPSEPSDSQDRLVGTVLHGYRLISLLGKGSVARVYRAKHLVLEREYAVKVLFGRAGMQERGKVRLQREAQALGKLHHPNVVQVFDFGFTDDGRPFLTMELLEGQTIKALVTREGPLEPMRAGAIARQLAMGLDAAHRAGFVHRDLKPSNVMLVEEDGREVAKILDFGIARAEAHGTRITASDQLLGTPRYMAPEQIRGASNVGPSADLYALGTVLYTMLTGNPPFLGSTVEVIEKQLSEKPKPLETGSALDELTTWLLAKAPEDRPQSAEHVIAWLEKAGYRDEVTRTQLMPESPRTALVSMPAARGPSKLLIPAMVALVLAIVALSGALLWPKTNPDPIVVPPPRPQLATKEPVVIARPEVEPLRPPPPPPAVEKVEAPPKRNKQVRIKKEAPGELEKTVRASMRKRGLSRRDLAQYPQLQPLLRAFESEQEPEARSRAGHELIEALERFPLDEAMVKAKLDRVAKSLATANGKLDQSALDRLENRYLDLRSTFRPGLSPSELSVLMIRIDELERELD